MIYSFIDLVLILSVSCDASRSRGKARDLLPVKTNARSGF
jgi:hypothetical protein